MEVPWQRRVEDLSGLPSTFGYTAQSSAPTGWSFNGYVNMDVNGITSYYQRDAGANVQRATWEFDVACTGSSGTNSKFTCYFVIGDATRSAQLTLTPSTVEIWVNGGASRHDYYETDMTWFRRIRFIKDVDEYRAWVDGHWRLTGSPSSGADDRTYFGQGTNAPHGTMAIRAMRWTNRGAFDPRGPGLWVPRRHLRPTGAPTLTALNSGVGVL